MAGTTSVETAIYRLQVEGQDKVDALTASVEALAEAENSAAPKARATSEALYNRIARLDPLIRAQKEYANSLAFIESAQERGVGTLTEINALMDLTTRKYEAQTKAIQEQIIAQENLRRSQANAAAGPGQVVQAAGGRSAYVEQFEAAAKAQDEQIASINRLRAAMNPLEVEQGIIGKQMAVYRTALQEGKISQHEYAAAQEQGAA